LTVATPDAIAAEAKLRALDTIAKAKKCAARRDQEKALWLLYELIPFFEDANFLRANPGVLAEATKIFQSLPIAAEVRRECQEVARFLSGLHVAP
jgi:hypothetical protein